MISMSCAKKSLSPSTVSPRHRILGRPCRRQILLVPRSAQPYRLLQPAGSARAGLDITAQRTEQQRLEIERDLAAALAAGTERQPLLATMLDIALRFPEFDAGGICWRQPDGSYRLIAQRGRRCLRRVGSNPLPPDSPAGSTGACRRNPLLLHPRKVSTAARTTCCRRRTSPTRVSAA